MEGGIYKSKSRETAREIKKKGVQEKRLAFGLVLFYCRGVLFVRLFVYSFFGNGWVG